MEQVRVNLRGIINAKFSELNPFQNDIKELSEPSYQAMKQAIVEDGFSFSPHVFSDAQGKLWLLDGHQRRTCLERMAKEGYEIPSIPCMEVEAENLEHARRLVLEAASQYGTFKVAKLVEFSKQIGITPAAALDRLVLPSVNFGEVLAAGRVKNEEKDLDPIAGDGFVPESFYNASIKQIVLYFPAETYNEYIEKATALVAKEGVKDFTELFMRLVDERN